MLRRFFKRNGRLLQVFSFIIFVFYLNGNLESIHVDIPPWVKTEIYPPFEPEINEDFQTVTSKIPRIPQILHQYNTDQYIPISYVPNVKSFIRYNPSWKYSFWTEETSRQLIAEKHLSLLPTWDGNANYEYRTKIIRYVILYEFGGAFADMKVNCLRSLKRVTYKYACVIPARSFELDAIKEKRPYALSNNMIFCRAKHPFFKHIIDVIPLYQSMIDINDAIGTHFLTSQFLVHYNLQQMYHEVHKDDQKSCNSKDSQKSCNSPFIYRGGLPDEHMNAVFVSNSKYFPTDVSSTYKFCQDFFSLSYIQKRGCIQLAKIREGNVFAFTFDNYKLRGVEKLLNRFFSLKITYIANVNV